MQKARKAKRVKGSVVDEKYLGPEPVLSESSKSIDIIQFYNWHNYFHNSDDAKSFVISYHKKIKADKELIKKLNKVRPDDLRTVGWHCRNLLIGGSLPKGLLSDISNRVNILTKNLDAKDEPEVEEVKPQIQERIENRASELIASLEDEIDKFCINQKNDFDIQNWFRNNAIKPLIAKRIAGYYQPLYSEVYDAVEGKDEQLVEAYHSWNKKALKQFLEFIRTIISTAETFAVAVKIERKPRKKKQKPANLIIKKLKYKEKDENFSIVSINPVGLVGSDQLWTYNTKSRALSVYNSLGPVGLSVKGTTITGYDEKTSVTKKLRKPEEVLPKVLEGGKLVLRKLMDELTTTSKEANGRINTDTILLRAIK